MIGMNRVRVVKKKKKMWYHYIMIPARHRYKQLNTIMCEIKSYIFHTRFLNLMNKYGK